MGLTNRPIFHPPRHRSISRRLPRGRRALKSNRPVSDKKRQPLVSEKPSDFLLTLICQRHQRCRNWHQAVDCRLPGFLGPFPPPLGIRESNIRFRHYNTALKRRTMKLSRLTMSTERHCRCLNVDQGNVCHDVDPAHCCSRQDPCQASVNCLLVTGKASDDFRKISLEARREPDPVEQVVLSSSDVNR